MNVRTLAAITACAAIAGAVLTASPALAHEAPKPGAFCTSSGQVEDNHGTLYVCTTMTAGAKPRWGTGLSPSASSLTISDSWAKAADSGMSAAFGVIKNPTRKPIRIIAATSPYSTFLQLHEMATKDGAVVMQQKQGGFVVPAGGSLELKPGGNHVMFMKVTKPITAGGRIPLTLITADGALLKTTVMGKVFAGANETYDDGTGDTDHSHTMSGM